MTRFHSESGSSFFLFRYYSSLCSLSIAGVHYYPIGSGWPITGSEDRFRILWVSMMRIVFNIPQVTRTVSRQRCAKSSGYNEVSPPPGWSALANFWCDALRHLMYIAFPGGLHVLFILSPLEYARLQQGHWLPADKLSPGWITLWPLSMRIIASINRLVLRKCFTVGKQRQVLASIHCNTTTAIKPYCKNRRENSVNKCADVSKRDFTFYRAVGIFRSSNQLMDD